MKIETLAQEIFDLCTDRSKTSKEITNKLVSNLSLLVNEDTLMEIENAIRMHKNSGTGLEDTCKKIINSLNLLDAADKLEFNSYYRVKFSF